MCNPCGAVMREPFKQEGGLVPDRQDRDDIQWLAGKSWAISAFHVQRQGIGDPLRLGQLDLQRLLEKLLEFGRGV